MRLDLAGEGKGGRSGVKHKGTGTIRGTYRGQFGVESRIKATTGLQAKDYEHPELVTFLNMS